MKKWNKPVHIESSVPLPTGVEIEYRGLWQTFDNQVHTARLRQAEAEVSLQHLLSERDLLRFENEELNIKFRDTLASLTETASSQMQSQEILTQIRAEKEAQANRLLVLEAHTQWLEGSARQLTSNVQHWQQKHAEALAAQDEQQKTIDSLTSRLSLFEASSRTKDERTAELAKQLAAAREEVQVLERSRAAKDRLHAHSLREQARLQAEVDELKKAVAAPRVRRQDPLTPVTPSPAPSTPSSSRRAVRTPSTPVPVYSPAPLLDLLTGDAEARTPNPWASPSTISSTVSTNKSKPEGRSKSASRMGMRRKAQLDQQHTPKGVA